ncbi:Splicing factor 3B subunit 1 [Hordeum vulgare]|nr:Splicing factor 3B subunit 1 [Hordeum vulgare]
MARIVNKEFCELAQTGLNYVPWASHSEIFLEGKNLLRAIGKGTLLAPTDPKFAPENVEALHFLYHHICPTLKDEYMVERTASGLCTSLKERFERLKYTVKPRAEAEWIRLRFAHFKTVGEYNSALHRICTTLQCNAPHEVVDAYKAQKARETHLSLVQEKSPPAHPAAPVMIPTPPPAPIVATSVVPIAIALAVSNDNDVAMEVEHMVAPTVLPLDVDVATKMMSIEDGTTGLEI